MVNRFVQFLLLLTLIATAKAGCDITVNSTEINSAQIL